MLKLILSIIIVSSSVFSYPNKIEKWVEVYREDIATFYIDEDSVLKQDELIIFKTKVTGIYGTQFNTFVADCKKPVVAKLTEENDDYEVKYKKPVFVKINVPMENALKIVCLK